jgi:16S rRNA (adenine1518-N6/adenine1519-N6)-dimethyltransferase
MMPEPLRPKKALGQNFLRDPNLARKLVAALSPGPGDLVLEYGCGTGVLTRLLAASGARVVGVEIDAALLDRLRADPALTGVLWRDEGLEALPPARAAVDYGVARVKLIGNLPYQLSATALWGAIEGAEHLERAVFMLQREVAERIQAPPGSRRYGVLPALLQARFGVEKVLDAGPLAFFPPPAVRSRALRLTPLAAPRVPAAQWPRYRSLVKHLFQERRKQLRPLLRKFYRLDDPFLLEVERASGLDLSRRPETLGVEEMLRLAAVLPESEA